MASQTNNQKILYWNAQSIHPKRSEIFDYLCENKIDVALFQETWLKPNLGFDHPLYHCYRLDRIDAKCGGVAIVILKTISHKLLPNFTTTIIESIGIEIETTTSPIKLISAYYPGTNETTNTRAWFKNDISALTNSSGSYFICGDFNARHRFWNCARRNNRGTDLYEAMSNGRFIVMYPPYPTHHPTQRRCQPSTIDIILTNGIHDMSQSL